MRGDKECSLGGVTNSGRIWRKGAEKRGSNRVETGTYIIVYGCKPSRPADNGRIKCHTEDKKTSFCCPVGMSRFGLAVRR